MLCNYRFGYAPLIFYSIFICSDLNRGFDAPFHRSFNFFYLLNCYSRICHLLMFHLFLFWIFGYSNRAVSIAVILSGTMFYTWVKHVEGQRQQRGGPTPPPAYASRSNSEEDMTLEDVKVHPRDHESRRPLMTVREDEEVVFDVDREKGRD